MSTVLDARLFELLESVPAGIIVFDSGGSVVYVNAAWRQIFGDEAVARIKRGPITETYDLYVAGTNDRYPVERLPITRAFHGERSREMDIEVRLPERTRVLDVSAA